jgi:nitroreductase
MVQSVSVKQQLADQAMIGAGNQFRTRDCSALAVFLADLEASKRIQRVYELENDWGKRHPSYQAFFPLSSAFMLGEGHAATLLKQFTSTTISELNLQAMPQIEPIQAWAYKNTSLVAQSYILAVTSHGLATTIMEGFDSLRMKKVLRIPDRYDIPMVVATGYDYDENEKAEPTPRLDLNEIVFSDIFGYPLALLDKSTEGSEDERLG